MNQKIKTKILSISLILSLIFLGACSTQKQQNPQINNQEIIKQQENLKIINIVAFGDSLTKGLGVEPQNSYPAQLQESLNNKFKSENKSFKVKITNTGLSGETTTGALERTDWVLSLNPEIIILEIGPNDGFRGIPIEIITENINQIIKNIKINNPDIKIILAQMTISDNLGQKYVEEFEDTYITIANQNNITLLPGFLDSVVANPKFNQVDEIHPTKEGYSQIVKQIRPIIEKVILDNFQ